MKNAILLIFVICFANLVQGQSNNSKTSRLLIGTYTTSATNDGIFVYDFDNNTAAVKLKSKISGVENPSYLTISRDGKFVYAVNEVKDGGVSSFLFDNTSGELKFLNKVSSGGSGPCYVSVDDKNKYVFAGNYNSGSFAAIPLKDDGSLGADPQFIQQDGSSINKGRQQGPHLHCTVLSPDNKYLLTSNLGTDKVGVYKFDITKVSQPLTPADPPFVSVIAGNGPRHITFHPNSKFAYLINEMSASIIVFDYKDGKLTEKQSITMLSPDFKGKVGAADIHISADGKFLYGSNRGEANEVVIYSIDKKGLLTYAGRQSCQGKGPRNFVIDPSGNFLLVANQDSNEIVFFKRDQITGMLTPTGDKIQISKPVCLKFIY
jgi:6-phosphogluconolactonase